MYYHLIWGNQTSRNEKKGGRIWCHTYLFLMSLLLVLNHINHHGNFKGKPRVTLCENSKSRITLLGQITSHAAKLGAINSRWKFGSLHASRKTYTTDHSVKSRWRNGHACCSSFQQFFSSCRRCRWNKIPAPAGRIEPSVTILNAREKSTLLWLDHGGYLV